MFFSWLHVRDILNQASDAFLAQPAAAGAHADELFPLFAFTPLAQAGQLEYISDGMPQVLPVPSGSHFLSTARVCRICHCTELDCSACVERTGEPCSWVSMDLCSACVESDSAESPAHSVRKTSLAQALAPIC